MKESLISALLFHCVGKMHRSPEDETSGVCVLTAVQPILPTCEQALRVALAATFLPEI